MHVVVIVVVVWRQARIDIGGKIPAAPWGCQIGPGWCRRIATVRRRSCLFAGAGCLALAAGGGLLLKGCVSFGPPPRETMAAAFAGGEAPRDVDWTFEGRSLHAMEVGADSRPLVVFVHG